MNYVTKTNMHPKKYNKEKGKINFWSQGSYLFGPRSFKTIASDPYICKIVLNGLWFNF